MPILTSRLLSAQIRNAHVTPQLIVHTAKTALTSDQSKPVSVVFGFGGAKRKHVEKYTALYENEGIPCVSYTGVNWKDNVPEPSEGAAFAPLFEDPTYRDRNLILHVISMNGFRSMAKLYRWMDHHSVGSDKITGVMFDSCPSVTGLNSTLHGMSATNPPSVLGDYAHLPESICHTVSSCAMANLRPELMSARLLFHYVLKECQLPHEQHYIYSKADQVIDYKYIEQFLAAQLAKGYNVTSKRYEDIAHVRHINKDAVGYSKQVVQLIERSRAPIKIKTNE